MTPQSAGLGASGAGADTSWTGRGYGGLGSTHSRDSGGNRMGISGDGLWGTERSEPGTRRAWGLAVVGIARSLVGSRPRVAVMRAGPWCSLLTHLTSRCLCRSGPLPPPGSPGLTAPAPCVGWGGHLRAAAGEATRSHGGWGSFPPSSGAPLRATKGWSECSGRQVCEGPRDTTWLPCSGEGGGDGCSGLLPSPCHSTTEVWGWPGAAC